MKDFFHLRSKVKTVMGIVKAQGLVFQFKGVLNLKFRPFNFELKKNFLK